VLVAPDGGELALDWYLGHGEDGDRPIRTSPNPSGDGDGGRDGADGGLHLPDDAPVVAVMHTLTGSAADFVELAREAAARGFRVAVCLRRGHLGVPLRTPRFNLLGSVADLDIHLGAIRRRYPAAPLFGYGESAGTGQGLVHAHHRLTIPTVTLVVYSPELLLSRLELLRRVCAHCPDVPQFKVALHLKPLTPPAKLQS